MCALKLTLTKEGEDLGFRNLLEEIFNKCETDALFENPTYVTRRKNKCRGLTRNETDCEELIQEVDIKVSQKILDQFTPDDTKPFGNFFAWLRPIAETTYIDRWRTEKGKFADERPEELLNLKAEGTDADILLLRSELFEHVDNITVRERREATRWFLAGYSLRRIKKALLEQGITCSHVTIQKWVSDTLKPFFSDPKVLWAWQSGRKERRRTRRQSDENRGDNDQSAEI